MTPRPQGPVATAKHSTPRPDDGTSKPRANVDREFAFRDSTGTPGRGASKRGTTRPKRRLGAEEWADLPWIEGTAKLVWAWDPHADPPYADPPPAGMA
jgi:hypothetical protein